MEETKIIDDIENAENLPISDEMDLEDANQESDDAEETDTYIECQEPEIEEYPEEIEENIDGEEIPTAPVTHDEEEAIEGTLEEE